MVEPKPTPSRTESLVGRHHHRDLPLPTPKTIRNTEHCISPTGNSKARMDFVFISPVTITKEGAAAKICTDIDRKFVFALLFGWLH